MTCTTREDALDPASDSQGRQYELPNDYGGLVVAFWISPDSTKLLCLTAAGKSREEISSQKAQFRVGLNSDMQWQVFNFPLQELRAYDTFKVHTLTAYIPPLRLLIDG